MITKNDYNIYDIFNSIFDDVSNIMSLPMSTPIYQGNFPPCDVLINKESKDLMFKFALAGISKQDISMETEGDYLYLDIQKADDTEEGYTVIQHGIKRTHTKRKFYIPSSRYNHSKINVSLKDGLLTIYAPVKEDAKPKKVLIK